jgi:hypothetical protein
MGLQRAAKGILHRQIKLYFVPVREVCQNCVRMIEEQDEECLARNREYQLV